MDKLTELLSANEAQAQEITTLKASLATAQAEATQAKADLASVTTERDALKASQADFDKRVAAEVAKAGILSAPVAKVVPSATKQTASMPLSEFSKMSAFERNEFIREGGKLTD